MEKMQHGMQILHNKNAAPLRAAFSRFVPGGLAEETEQDTGGHGGADHAGDVGRHGVGQQVVGRIGFETHLFGYARGIRHGGHAGVADERVDLLALGQEQVHELREEHAEGGGDHEGRETKAEDEGPTFRSSEIPPAEFESISVLIPIFCITIIGITTSFVS